MAYEERTVQIRTEGKKVTGPEFSKVKSDLTGVTSAAEQGATSARRWQTEYREMQRQALATANASNALYVDLGKVNQLTQQFGGGSAMRNAEHYAAAVQRIGGASKLTAAEQAGVHREVSTAIEKYRVLGQQAPAHLVALQRETAGATKGTGLLQSSVARLATAFSAAALLDRGISFVTNLGREPGRPEPQPNRPQREHAWPGQRRPRGRRDDRAYCGRRAPGNRRRPGIHHAGAGPGVAAAGASGHLAVWWLAGLVVDATHRDHRDRHHRYGPGAGAPGRPESRGPDTGVPWLNRRRPRSTSSTSGSPSAYERPRRRGRKRRPRAAEELIHRRRLQRRALLLPYAELITIAPGALAHGPDPVTTGVQLVEYFYGRDWYVCGQIVTLADAAIARVLGLEPPPGTVVH